MRKIFQIIISDPMMKFFSTQATALDMHRARAHILQRIANVWHSVARTPAFQVLLAKDEVHGIMSCVYKTPVVLTCWTNTSKLEWQLTAIGLWNNTRLEEVLHSTSLLARLCIACGAINPAEIAIQVRDLYSSIGQDDQENWSANRT